ncbi:hypothetical protein [Hoeflea sp.]|uniref:hypothetical protein n=1 Tax=Hoeflea sp. TaxID=1940281 RepID=UPI003B027E6F
MRQIALLFGGVHIEHAAADLVFLDRFEERPEIALAKALVALARRMPIGKASRDIFLTAREMQIAQNH